MNGNPIVKRVTVGVRTQEITVDAAAHAVRVAAVEPVAAFRRRAGHNVALILMHTNIVRPAITRLRRNDDGQTSQRASVADHLSPPDG